MVLPQEIIDRFDIAPREVFDERFGDKANEIYCREFLTRTDYLTNKQFDTLMNALSEATAVTFIAVYIKTITTL